MHLISGSTSAGLLLSMAATLAACGEAAGDDPGGAAGRGAAVPCPSIAEIETAVGYPVKQVSVPVDGCMYELTGRYRGVFVTLMYQPATRANDVFADITRRVRGAGGSAAKPDTLKLGEGGWSYSSRSHREAAAVSKGRLYHVEMDLALFESLKLPENAAVRVIELGMRAAPGAASAASATGGGNGASLDACTLATNAEFSQIAEERPEIAKYWSAPTASFGGAHCDYDGGSIRLYRGKNAAAAVESTLKSFKADEKPKVPVSGIGDKAFFTIPFPDDKYKRLGLLVAYAGPDVLQLTLDAQGDEPVDATRPRLERLARLVVPRLR
jgi:hypothetical protein